jgi:hypothetical protein
MEGIRLLFILQIPCTDVTTQEWTCKVRPLSMCCKDFLIVCSVTAGWRAGGLNPCYKELKHAKCQSTGEIAVALNRAGASGRVLYPCRTFLRYRLLAIYRY